MGHTWGGFETGEGGEALRNAECGMRNGWMERGGMYMGLLCVRSECTSIYVVSVVLAS